MGLIGLVRAARAFLRSEWRNVRQFDVPWRRRVWLYWNGFLSSRDALWGLTAGTVDQYLSDRQHRDLARIDRPYEAGLKNKVLFHLIVSRTHEDLLAGLHGLVRDGEFVPVNRADVPGGSDGLAELVTDRRIVVKPVTAAKGDGVRVVDGRGDRPRVDGRPLHRADLAGALAADRDLLVTEFVEQADYAATVYPDAANSLRLLTMLDPRTGEPFLAGATHRFGTAGSGRVDNWSAGGLSAEVDLETGNLGPAVRRPGAGDSDAPRYGAHPDTGARIAGLPVPAWDRVVETVLDLAREYGWLWPHVGWDVVVVDDRGSVVILEGDPKSVDADLQAHRPLLADDRRRRFYEHHGVVSDSRRVTEP